MGSQNGSSQKPVILAILLKGGSKAGQLGLRETLGLFPGDREAEGSAQNGVLNKPRVAQKYSNSVIQPLLVQEFSVGRIYEPTWVFAAQPPLPGLFLLGRNFKEARITLRVFSGAVPISRVEGL